MDKKQEFLAFARNNPQLAKHIKNGNMTWQKFYELYDIYGEDESVWSLYQKEDDKDSVSIQNLVKSIDVDKIEGHLQNASKALDLIAELTKKDVTSSAISNVAPRPITNFFKD